MEKMKILLSAYDKYKKDSELFKKAKVTVIDGVCDAEEAGTLSLPLVDLLFDISEEGESDYEELLDFFKYKNNIKYLASKAQFEFFLKNINTILNTQIKLVIWDLDETLWDGTISETNVYISNEIKDILNELLDHGIMNSICSKNDFNQASEKLKELGIKDFFVFPSISWERKGQRVFSIIEAMNLRPSNVLFIDDMKINLEDAKHIAPELNTYLKDNQLIGYLKKIIEHSKKDSNRKRLSMYKILEEKNSIKREFDSEEDFLYTCNIEVFIERMKEEHLDRVFEMIHRTNQLNYTKARWSMETLDSTYVNSDSFVVRASDRFGDYGIIGVCILDKGKALQFLFSCRIMNMGIESFIYQHMGRPRLKTVKPIASPIVEQKIDWIKLHEDY